VWDLHATAAHWWHIAALLEVLTVLGNLAHGLTGVWQ
jgi:hypothetical protein